MRVWVTRTQPGAAATAARLEALGHAPLVDPLLQVRRLPAALKLSGVTALAFSSANGVHAFADLAAERALTAYAVGAATAEALRAAGFAEVRTAAGDVASLAALIAADRPACVLHIAPAAPAGDLAGALAAAGVPARTAALYETLPLRPGAALKALAAGELDAALVHSPRAAAVLDSLGVPPDRRIPVFGISEAAVRPLARGGWNDLHAARAPDEASLLALLPR